MDFIRRLLRRQIGHENPFSQLGVQTYKESLTQAIQHAKRVKDKACLSDELDGSFTETTLAAPSVEGQVVSQSNVGLPTDDKARKELQLWTFLMEYFPDAWLAVVGVSIAGNKQHNPGQPLHWARCKSKDQMNTAFRHMWDYGRGVKRDTDGQYHLAKAIWRLSAELQLLIEKERSNADV